MNIMTPGCVTPTVRCVSTPALPGPVSPPPYSPPHQSTAQTPLQAQLVQILRMSQLLVEIHQEKCSGGSVIIDPGQPRPGNPVFKRQSVLTLREMPKACNDQKLWQKIQSELSKELFQFCKDVTENIGTYSQLVDFAVKCDVRLTWLERAKEDYPQGSQAVVNKVFYEWWDRCNLNLRKKIQMIQAAFGYIGIPAIFNRILYMCPDLEMLHDHATSDTMPALTGGDGKTNTQKTHVLDSVEMLAHEKIKTGKITAVQHDLIQNLSAMIWSQGDYETICDSLGVPPEYGPMAKPRYETWMLQTEATLLKFYVCTKSYLFRMARIRMAFNACGYLMYCDETLVSRGHRISAINDYARVDDLPNECPSADSCSNSGDDSPRMIRDARDSAEDSDDETGQPQGAVMSTSNAHTSKTSNAHTSKASNANNKSPSCESETGTENLTPVIEYEETHNQIDLTDEDIQGIVSLRMERNAVKGETRKQVLERLMPTVVFDDINKDKTDKGHFEPK